MLHKDQVLAPVIVGTDQAVAAVPVREADQIVAVVREVIRGREVDQTADQGLDRPVVPVLEVEAAVVPVQARIAAVVPVHQAEAVQDLVQAADQDQTVAVVLAHQVEADQGLVVDQGLEAIAEVDQVHLLVVVRVQAAVQDQIVAAALAPVRIPAVVLAHQVEADQDLDLDQLQVQAAEAVHLLEVVPVQGAVQDQEVDQVHLLEADQAVVLVRIVAPVRVPAAVQDRQVDQDQVQDQALALAVALEVAADQVHLLEVVQDQAVVLAHQVEVDQGLEVIAAAEVALIREMVRVLVHQAEVDQAVVQDRQVAAVPALALEAVQAADQDHLLEVDQVPALDLTVALEADQDQIVDLVLAAVPAAEVDQVREVIRVQAAAAAVVVPILISMGLAA